MSEPPTGWTRTEFIARFAASETYEAADTESSGDPPQ
jgi:hypothetical protein